MARRATTVIQTGGAAAAKPTGKQWSSAGNFLETEQVAKSLSPRAHAQVWHGLAPLITSQKQLLLPAQAKQRFRLALHSIHQAVKSQESFARKDKIGNLTNVTSSRR